MQFSDESYDVEIKRKSSKDFISSASLTSGSSYPMKVYIPSYMERSNSITIGRNQVAKFAKAICDFQSDNDVYLSHLCDQSLSVFDEVSTGVYKARNKNNRVGLVFGENIEFYSGEFFVYDYMLFCQVYEQFCLNISELGEEKFVKAAYSYEGLDEQELTFPIDAVIRLLRKNTKRNMKIDGEEWWEGEYNWKLRIFLTIFFIYFEFNLTKGVFCDKIGFFPCIFVQEISDEKHIPNNLIDLEIKSPTGSKISSGYSSAGIISPEQTVP